MIKEYDNPRVLKIRKYNSDSDTNIKLFNKQSNTKVKVDATKTIFEKKNLTQSHILMECSITNSNEDHSYRDLHHKDVKNLE